MASCGPPLRLCLSPAVVLFSLVLSAQQVTSIYVQWGRTAASAVQKRAFEEKVLKYGWGKVVPCFYDSVFRAGLKSTVTVSARTADGARRYLTFPPGLGAPREVERLAGRSGASLRFTSAAEVEAFWRDTVLVFDTLALRFGRVPGLGRNDLQVHRVHAAGDTALHPLPFVVDPFDRQAVHLLAAKDLDTTAMRLRLSSNSGGTINTEAFFRRPASSEVVDLLAYAHAVREAWALDEEGTVDVLEGYCALQYGHAAREELMALVRSTAAR